MEEKLPLRHQNQDLEERSRRFFENCLPNDWLAYKPPNDYGVDLHVDIFKNGKATGLDFLIQLKSSNQKSENPYESLILKVSTYNYLKGKLQLVVVVKYNQEENEAYWIFLKDIPNPNPNNKSFTVKIPKENKLSKIDWTKIYNYIHKISDEKLARTTAFNQEERHLATNSDSYQSEVRDSLTEKVQKKVELIQFEKDREIFNNSKHGVIRAEEEVGSLYQIIKSIANDIHNPTSGIYLNTTFEENGWQKILEVHSKNLILRFEWYCRVSNSLSRAGLGIWLTKGFRHFNDYGEQGQTISHKIYYSNIDEEDHLGWSESRDISAIISSESLAVEWLEYLLDSM